MTTWTDLRRGECFLSSPNKPNSVFWAVYFSSGISWDQLMSVPKFSSSRPGKLISKRILLKLSFMVSKIRPSTSDRFSVKPEAGSSRDNCFVDLWLKDGELVRGLCTVSLDSVLSSSQEDSGRGLLRGVLLKPSKSWFSWQGVNGSGRVLTGLKSSSLPLLADSADFQGSRPPSGGVVVAGTLQGVEETGNLLNISLTGVLKGPLSSCRHLSCDAFSRGWFSCSKGRSAPNWKGSNSLLSGKIRTGSSEQGSARCCFLLDLLISRLSHLFITNASETPLDGDFSMVKHFFSITAETGTNESGSSFTVTVEAKGDSQSPSCKPSSSLIQSVSGKEHGSSPGWQLFSFRECVGEKNPSSHWLSSLTVAMGKEDDSSIENDIYKKKTSDTTTISDVMSQHNKIRSITLGADLWVRWKYIYIFVVVIQSPVIITFNHHFYLIRFKNM